jgi:phosphoenolpyruvate carboxykinase (GTP)
MSKHGQTKPANASVTQWAEEVSKLTKPDNIFWCDGSEDEKKHLTDLAVEMGIIQPLNQEKWPGCYYHRSNANDVARVENLTFICTAHEEEVGPTNNWAEPDEMRAKLHALLDGAMKGRTMYVVPYLMGPPGSDMSRVGVEVTDSIYVALSMRIMARTGQVAMDHLGNDSDKFNRGIHSMLDINPDRRFIAHFPYDNEIISVGSNYGGNVLLGKKCLALRLASWWGRQEGWMAEHMLILGVESPTGRKTYVAGAFPSACGKTNFAMLIPPERFKGWKVWTVGDDIAWMKPGEDGRLHAINPEAGYFGVVPGTNNHSNPNAMQSLARDTIFTNVAITPDGDVWWEGKDNPPPDDLIDWQGNPWKLGSDKPAAHPNSRFTAPAANNPMLAPEADDPNGVPIDAIIFGGRRSHTIPLVFQSFNWLHGVYVGATVGSETTAAATGATGQIRRDPMAMLPFCGYNMGDYFVHWIRMRKLMKYPPRIFHVNWFRKDDEGNFLWPGFGENMRVLRWIVDRCCGEGHANETSLGWVPGSGDFDLVGLPGFTEEKLERAQQFSDEEWRREVLQHDELFFKLYGHLPKEIIFQRELLIARL